MPPTRMLAALTLTLCSLAMSSLLAVPPAANPAIFPIAFEMAEKSRFVDAKFPGLPSRAQPDSGLVVAGGGTNWWDRVQLDTAWGNPFRLGRRVYRRGLFCHAPRHLQVKLPRPGNTFASAIGVLSYGTVIFAVKSGDEELFRSDIVRQGDDPVEVGLALDGTRELTLITEDAGDNIGGDHGVWANARVTLDDGSELWLGDLDIVEGQSGLAFEKGLPFSFQYGGKSSAELLPNWKQTVTVEEIDEQRRGFTITFTDPGTKLEVRCEGIEYLDFPTVEWTLYFRNNGSKDSPILEDILAIDTTLPNHESDGRAEFVLHHHLGSQATREDYAPRKTVLTANESKRFRPPGGRPSSHVWPYFNIQRGGTGFILALGWPGQWAAEFTRDAGTNLHVRGGQELTHLKLQQGEEIRTPLIVLQFYNGDRVRSQNIWRRWMLAHNLPRPGGKLPPPQVTAVSARAFGWMYNATEENQKQMLDIYARENIELDYWWMDTGWGDAVLGPDAKRFPNGMRPISEHAHKLGVGTILWFEPERTQKTAKLAKEHPDWVLWAPKNDQGLLDFGHPDALAWINDAVHKILDEDLIDYYRVDFNMDPLEHWRNNEAEDRRGMVENKWVTGFLAHWDELLRRNPDLRIDSCASGGRRNDLESMRRGVPLWRSDYTDRGWFKNSWQRGEATGTQGHVYGISSWLPYHGHSMDYARPKYQARSNLYPATNMNLDVREEDYDFDALREAVALCRVVAPNYMGDFYPLTPYTLEEDVWMVWQFHRPEVGKGLVQAYQRDESIYPTVQIRLRGLDRDAEYEITNHDHPDTTSTTGAELMDSGLRITVELEERPWAVIITYKRKVQR